MASSTLTNDKAKEDNTKESTGKLRQPEEKRELMKDNITKPREPEEKFPGVATLKDHMFLWALNTRLSQYTFEELTKVKKTIKNGSLKTFESNKALNDEIDQLFKERENHKEYHGPPRLIVVGIAGVGAVFTYAWDTFQDPNDPAIPPLTLEALYATYFIMPFMLTQNKKFRVWNKWILNFLILLIGLCYLAFNIYNIVKLDLSFIGYLFLDIIIPALMMILLHIKNIQIPRFLSYRDFVRVGAAAALLTGRETDDSQVSLVRPILVIMTVIIGVAEVDQVLPSIGMYGTTLAIFILLSVQDKVSSTEDFRVINIIAQALYTFFLLTVLQYHSDVKGAENIVSTRGTCAMSAGAVHFVKQASTLAIDRNESTVAESKPIIILYKSEYDGKCLYQNPRNQMDTPQADE